MLEAAHVTRRFGSTVALDDVSLTVRSGELVGLLGPNGAGKTTLLSLATGLRRPDAGTVRLFGGDPRSPASRVLLGTTPQETGLPPTLRVGEVVDFIAGHYPDPMPRAELLDRFGLGDLARRQTGALSGGQRRRLAVALALVGRPRLVVLDEPTTGLDVEGRHELWSALREYHAGGATVVVTSHYLEEIEALAQRVVVMGGGRVLADDALAAVLARVSVRRLSFALDDPADAASVERLPAVVGLEHANGRLQVLARDADAVVRALVDEGLAFRGLEIRGASLEEAFLSLTAASAGDTAGHTPSPSVRGVPAPDRREAEPMTTTSSPALRAPSVLRLAALHARYQFTETVRVPIAVIGNMLFPALAMFFFVVPQRSVAEDPVAATAAVGQLGMFAVMSTCLFTYGAGVSEDRQQPFDPYLRTLPAGAGPRMAGRLANGAAFALLGLLPLALIGWLFTDASLPAGRLALAVLAIAGVALPFLLLGMAIGYSLSAKAALPVVQVVLFPLAFAGGLFLPPQAFPGWLDAISRALPSRAGRDLLVQALTGEAAYAAALPVLAGWGVVFAALAVAAYRRDEGRRFR